MSQAISDFTNHEKWVIQTRINERWGNGVVTTQDTDVDLRLTPGDRVLTTCPAIYRQQDECDFIAAKTYNTGAGDEQRYQNQLFYSVKDQFGTGIEEYSDRGECILTLLRFQADHESEQQNNHPVEK